MGCVQILADTNAAQTDIISTLLKLFIKNCLESNRFFFFFNPGDSSTYAGRTLGYFGNAAPAVKLTLDSPWQVIVAGKRGDYLRLSKQIQVSRKMKGFEGKPFGSSLSAISAVILHMTASTSISFSLIWSLCDSPSNSGVNPTTVS